MTTELKLSKYIKTSRIKPSQRPTASNYGGAGKFGVSLYIAYCRGFAKVGISGDPKTRIRTMQGGCPFPIRLIFHKPMSKKLAVKAEMQTMLLLDNYHSANDWFRCSPGSAVYAASKVYESFHKASPLVD